MNDKKLDIYNILNISIDKYIFSFISIVFLIDF